MAQAAKVETVTFQTNIIPKTHEQPVKLIAKLITRQAEWAAFCGHHLAVSGGIREEREVYCRGIGEGRHRGTSDRQLQFPWVGQIDPTTKPASPWQAAMTQWQGCVG